MRSYLIDEIGEEDVKRLHRYLSAKAVPSGVEGLFWVEFGPSLLTPLQQEHLPCHPHVFAVELGSKNLKAEFFLRTMKDMRCSCQGYCTPAQAHYIIGWINDMLQELSIRT